MNSVFSEQILADKLSKLNSTQQCIETLSHWCIFHRSKADLVVATWDREFHKSEMVRKVPLLYLANDILQNSKRKGNEFVSEFWKVLPAALKVVVENGDERGKTVVSRLVNIWEERKVFGSSVGNLKDVMLGEDAAPPLELGKKRSRSVKIVKRDSRSIRTKLSIGGTAEKIVSAFHLVDSERTNEDVEKSNCKSAIHRVRKMEKDVDVACISNEKDPKRETLAKELEEEENTLRQCIEKLKSVEASRLALVSQLKDALHEQESELENVRTQMQVAQVRADEANIMQKRLKNEDYVPLASTGAAQTDKRTAASIAAEVAEKLAASTSSQMIMHSVLSTFAAEEAKSAGLAKSSATVSESVPKAGERVQVSDHNAFIPPAQPFTVSNPSYQSGIPPQPSVQNQVPSSQGQYHALPNPQSQQYMQPSGGIMSSYGYGSITPLPPGPPPPPPYMVSPMVPLTQPQPPSHIAQQQQGPLGQQPVQRQPQGPGFQPLQPPGMTYYGHPPRS